MDRTFAEQTKRIASYAHTSGRVMMGPEYRDAVEAAMGLLEAEGVRCGVRRNGDQYGFVVQGNTAPADPSGGDRWARDRGLSD